MPRRDGDHDRPTGPRLPRAGVLGSILTVLAASACAPSVGRSTSELEEPLARSTAAISGDRLFQDLERYTAFGQRYYGAPRRGEALAMILRDLEPHAATVERQSFSAREPVTGVSFELTNVIARTAPLAARRILLGTHWDTRAWAEEDADPERRDQPIPGANDGTSGLVVLIELLRALPEVKLQEDVGVDLVFFDGEEFGRPGSEGDYCQGSSRFADELDRYYPDRLPVAAVVVDMVGDRELTFKREGYSRRHAPALTELIWRLGRARFPEVFLDAGTGPIFDDHVPLQRRGVPAALLIDRDYAPWHTHDDTPEACSAGSLALVTRHLAELLLVLGDPP